MTTAAVVGIGDISALHLQAIAETAGVELVAVCDTNGERAEKAATEWGVLACTDHQAMLAEARPEVVHITLPHHLHVPVALDALAAGSHVLTEKPLSQSVASARRLVDAAATSQKKVGVCFQNRYNPTSVALHEAVSSGAYGPVLGARASVWWSRGEAYYAAAPWRGRWAEGGGGVLINQTIHTIDLLCWLLGEPERVTGVASNLTHCGVIEVEDTATIVMEHPGGVRSGFFATNNHGTNSSVELEITCEGGVLSMAGGAVTAVRPDGPSTVLAEDVQAQGERSYWGKSHQLLIADFYAHLGDPEPFWIDPGAALVSLEVLRSVYVQSGLVPEGDR